MRARAAITAMTMTMAAVLVVLAFTMGPAPDGVVRSIATQLTPSGSVADRKAMGAVVELVLNVLLFVPLGLGLAAAVRSKVTAALVGALLSVGVELAQSTALIGRTPELTDVVMNSMGAVLGVVALSWLRDVVLTVWARPVWRFARLDVG